jgi:hypothetical protein
VIEFIAADSSVWLARAWGVSPDEQHRTREALFRLLAPASKSEHVQALAAVTRTLPQ